MSERFLILCRTPSDACSSLISCLSKLGTVELISDTPAEDAVWHADETMTGFTELNGFSQTHRPVTAWERAWKHLDLTSGSARSNVWLVEDDVAGSAAAWSRLVEETLAVDADLSAVDIRLREDDPHWPHWRHGDTLFANPGGSFNPLCRLSERLVSVVLEFRRCHGRFIFQEVLFASLMADHGFSFLDWNEYETTEHLFRSYVFRPEVTAFSKGICHPVKNPDIHKMICNPPDETD
jgi:hypothetical protein